ncbi:bifunctional hydroxymethylpyrimidine kinase/phosphomethylpyrimidine kinase [Candidatus Symbiobacter mobilis]|uniref:hydroxymethylpyrimidine kinase n=1 Tax=Candidatus Symbiobacter mobilis CR TaxID=946483 RepID=U5N9D2_9BURK|nr:bifunctional hydroxymethylpyrimidine kinase/phosphomethylpyrimidine kinase [Candidatus Symbiobacter mobilis]AGX88176.1 hydroxymethylpyrimidine/phosphomethylpyrimidine kinase [Candidatus Symbiobacter mobilis CR]
MQYPRVLTIAGSDSGGGAGIQADLKTFAALGCYGMSAITALTAQNTCEVRSIHSVPPEMLREQIDAVVQDIGVCAVKVGMLHCAEIVHTVAHAIDRYVLPHVVLDPVMVATSGAVLIDQRAVETLVQQLFPRSAIVTPNLDEAALLVGKPLTSPQDMAEAAQALLGRGAHAVLLKGGHLPGPTVTDLLLVHGQEPIWMATPRIDTPNTHGTGCTLSSAIAAHLALGASLVDAVQRAHDFVAQALRSGAAVRTGHGNGPLNHGFGPAPMRILPDDAPA